MAQAAEGLVRPPLESPFVLLVEGAAHAEHDVAYCFRAPRRILSCREPSEVEGCLSLADAAVRGGHYVAGFLAYEAGYALEPRLSRLPPKAPREHLVWLGVFDEKEELDAAGLERFLTERGGAGSALVERLSFDTTREQYGARFAVIQEHLRAGDSYQVCQSFRCHFELRGRAAALFQALRRRQVTSFSALIGTGDYDILSLSPELFFRKRGADVELKPMKGTSRRGLDPAEDAELAEHLRQDPKTRAENVMIVDLLRNDIGRLARPGSVQVPKLFSVERYDTVLQMTSTVTAQVEATLPVSSLLRSLFPCGSVTGAPKLRTMEIIHALEPTPRGIFCGSVGYVTPDNDACFNVAIRSLLIDGDGRGTLGIGGGVVVDSTSDAEREECLLKAEFLAAAAR